MHFYAILDLFTKALPLSRQPTRVAGLKRVAVAVLIGF